MYTGIVKILYVLYAVSGLLADAKKRKYWAKSRLNDEVEERKDEREGGWEGDVS